MIATISLYPAEQRRYIEQSENPDAYERYSKDEVAQGRVRIGTWAAF